MNCQSKLLPLWGHLQRNLCVQQQKKDFLDFSFSPPAESQQPRVRGGNELCGTITNHLTSHLSLYGQLVSQHLIIHTTG